MSNKLNYLAQVMKRDWDERARENARWYINTLRPDQSEAEFDASGAAEIEILRPELLLLAQGRDPRELRVLEIGCGIGRMTKHLAALFGEVHGVDVSGEMIAQASARLLHLHDVHFHETSGVDFAPLPADYFDLALSVYVFQHVPSKEIIRANLRAAFRVLKPGGVFGFHTNGVVAADYEELEKNTWLGASFTEDEIRQAARDLGAQLLGIYNAGTGYCWATLRKPLAVAAATDAQPRIEFYARADDAALKRIPTSGKDACVALLVSGLPREAVDANNVSVIIAGQTVRPRYVWRVKPHFATALHARFGAALEEMVCVEFALPTGLASGRALVCVAVADASTPPLEIELEEPQPVYLKIVTVRNAADYGTDVYARGPKSLLRLMVHGLDESAACANVRVQLGERLLEPCFVGFVPDVASYQVDVQLPEDVASGETSLSLCFKGAESEAVAVEVKA